MLDRRKFVAAGLSGIALSSFNPGVALAAASTDKKFIFVIQRGAADGLAILAPTGDPDFIRARGDAARQSLEGTKLNSFFTLHPKLPQAAKLFRQGDASFVHSVASGYRERSHFDAQNILESGGSIPYVRKDGWMNRLLSLLPDGRAKAIAVAPALPLVLRGTMPASSYEQSRLRGPNDDLLRRVEMLYAEDAQLSSLWENAVATDRMAGKPARGEKREIAAARMVAGLMRGPDGAGVIMMENTGWDTHSNQFGRLGARLSKTDEFVGALKEQMGVEWQNTLLVIATEFGRTVAFNGTKGTDHGTASAAMMFGGGLKKGGKVVADWPGLRATDLYEGRDLKPTMRFEDMMAGALADHFSLDEKRARKVLFPDLA